MRTPQSPARDCAGQSQLLYYYLWHFSAAELSLALRASGWEADVALTWFSAFASLSLLIGIAVWLSGRSIAAIFVVLLAAATSLRATLDWLFGTLRLDAFIARPTGFAGWLFQSAWAPQHLMAASCVIVAMLLIACLAHRSSALLGLTLALVVVAGFECSAFIGGITFAFGALFAVPILFLRTASSHRLQFVVGLVIAAVIAGVLASPFLVDQVHAMAARDQMNPINVRHFEVLGSILPERLRRLLDWPAYWIVQLPIELPATFIAGVLCFFVLLRQNSERRDALYLIALACLAGAGLFVSWLLVSTVGDNNDRGFRAVLPAAAIFIALAAAGVASTTPRTVIRTAAITGFLLSLPDTVGLIRSDFGGQQHADGTAFYQSPELWAAVRRYASATARVANNPLYLQDLTPWPGNMSWALLANRSSCFAGCELAMAFSPLPAPVREAINAQFIRVFAGNGTLNDAADFARKYGCDVVVIAPQDGAWIHDPFALSPDFHLAESRAGQWRIYTVAKPHEGAGSVD